MTYDELLESNKDLRKNLASQIIIFEQYLRVAQLQRIKKLLES